MEKKMDRMKRVKGIVMMMVVMVMGCNSGGGIKEGEEGKARKGDGSVIDLKTVSKKIRDAVAFAESVKEVHTLVKSVNELAKAVGMKIQNGDTLAADNNHNGGILAGSFQIISTVKAKLDILSETNIISDELKQKVNDSKSKAEAFLGKLKTNHSDLGKEGATDDHAKAAILVTNNTKDKGATELGQLNTSIGELLTAANELVNDAVKELTTPTNVATPVKP
ncbi:Vsp58 (plasmid) [Borrelia crocidurae str. Achema]|uniref:Vsp58 n=2 Tax=Borrelia crocidurae TaxID=29520 RepID=I0FEI9_BORCA|nr:Vsp58 [Borrelia crocidurae str. Achema]